MALNRGQLLLLLFCAGCSSMSSSQKQMYEQGYRAAVSEQLREIGGQFKGGKFPYYHWSAPIVQDVLVPAHIANGVFIPEHKELVIIKPGEWAQSPAYPIQTTEEIYEPTSENLDMETDGANITHLPNPARRRGVDESQPKESDSQSRVGAAK